MGRIRAEVERLLKRGYVEEEQAFCHYAMQTLYGLDEDEAAEACSFGTVTQDGPEALWDDEESGRIVLVKTVYAPGGRARVDRRAVAELARARQALKPCAERSSLARRGQGHLHTSASLETRSRLSAQSHCACASSSRSRRLALRRRRWWPASMARS